MRLIKVQIELGIEDGECGEYLEDIAKYLNIKLYEDPEFFGDFGPENIIEVKEMD